MRTPDLVGRGARAWRVSPDPRFPAVVARWLLHAPSPNMGWRWYQLSVVHLRDEAGVPSPILVRPGCSHELNVAMLDWSVAPDPDVGDTWPMLHPFEVVEQFDALTDEEAVDVAHTVVGWVAMGEVAPHHGSRPEWRRLLDIAGESLRRHRD